MKHRRWPYVVVIVAAVVGVLLFLAQDPQTLQVRSQYAATDPPFASYLASVVGAPLFEGDAVEVLENGDAIYPAMIAAIDAARTRVVFESYNFNLGKAGDLFADALTRAAGRGVRVRVVLDAFGAAVPPLDMAKRFKAAGVDFVMFHPVGMWTVEATNYRTHRKLLVVDGAVAFTGGAGVADHWFGHAEDKDHWRDTQFKLTGPGVRALESAFYENWLESGGAGPAELDVASDDDMVAASAVTNPAARTIVAWSNANGGASNIKLIYLYLIAAARRTIDLQSSYFVPDSSAAFVFAEARKRGVAIRILTDGDITDATSVRQASRHAYQSLLDQGARIFEYQPTMMHVKAMVVDGQWSVFGSANFDNRSLELNDENVVCVLDAALAGALTASFDRDVSVSREYTADGWRQRPWYQRARESMWGLFGEVF